MFVRCALLLLFAVSLATAQINFQHASYPAAPYGLVAVDVNGDGVPDLVSSDSSLMVMLNNGNGTFQPQVSVDWIGVPQTDLNGDGRPDIATCLPDPSGSPRVLGVSLAIAPMHYSSPQSYTLPGDCVGVSVADINGDRKPDLVVSWNGQDETAGITVLFGDGTGNFSSPVTTGPFTFQSSGGCIMGTVLTGDYDRDGKVDLLIPADCSGDSGYGVVLFAQGDGTGQFSLSHNLDGGPFAVRKDDVDQDGWLDMTGMWEGCGPDGTSCGGLDFYVNSRTPGPPRWKDVPIASSYCDPSGCYGSPVSDGLAADVDGDGTKDAVSLQWDLTNQPAYNKIFVQPGRADGTYAAPQMFMLPQTSQRLSVVAADFDRDGKMDLAVAMAYPNSIEIFLNRTASAPTCPADPIVRSVKVCAPSQLTGNSLHLLANTTDSDNVTGMIAYIDNTLTFYSPNQLMNRVLTVPNGGHRITTTAWDARGSFSSARWINVNTSFGCGAYSTNRSVHLCFPISNTTVGSPTQVIAAVRTSYAYHGAKIYIDGVSKYSTSSKQVNANLNLAAGKHRITVQSSDSQGTFSKTIYATVR